MAQAPSGRTRLLLHGHHDSFLQADHKCGAAGFSSNELTAFWHATKIRPFQSPFGMYNRTLSAYSNSNAH